MFVFEIGTKDGKRMLHGPRGDSVNILTEIEGGLELLVGVFDFGILIKIPGMVRKRNLIICYFQINL